MAPVDAQVKPRYEAGAGAIENAVDRLASSAHVSAQTVGGIGLDADYGILALVYQKLGDADKAATDIKKGTDYRTRQLGKVDGGRDFETFARFAALVAIAQGDLMGAANYVKTGNLPSDDYAHLLLVEVGRTQDAENALNIANIVGNRRDLWHAYSDMIPEMARAGKLDQVDKLVSAWSGDPRQKADFYWPIVDGMIANGDVDGARQYAGKYHLTDDARGKLGLDARLMGSPKIAGNRSKAEPVIREMFQIGEDMDKGSGSAYVGGVDRYTAQGAATAAFSNGYTDLGIELYEAATNKDQRPLLAAFTDQISKNDMSRVLMLAQDNVSGNYLGYVIDSAIRHLKKQAG
jgi:hypothetical protein